MKNSTSYILFTCLLFFISLNLAKAQVFENGSFEFSQTNPGSYIGFGVGSTNINGWMVESGNIHYIGTYWSSSDGNRSIDMNGSVAGSISQTFNTIIGVTYNVKFDLSGNPDGGPTIKILNVAVSNFTEDFMFDITGHTKQNMGWETIAFEFIAIDNLSTLTFSSLVSGHYGPAVDNVQVDGYDCAGTPNGTAVIDDCGECLEPTDPSFNQSCIDCEGTLNGTAVIDGCGECLEPTDPNFNQLCAEENKVYIPNAFSPNDDGVNDRFQVFADQGIIRQIHKYAIFDRWGNNIYQLENFEIDSFAKWWNGTFKGEKLQPGVFAYYIKIEFIFGGTMEYKGGLTIIK